MNPEISIVIPCFNEEEAIPIFYEETLKVLKTMPLSSLSLFLLMTVLLTKRLKS